MRHGLWALAPGILFTGFFPSLPSPGWVAALALPSVAFLCFRHSRLLGWFLLGMAYGSGWGHWQLCHRLPPEQDKVDVEVTGIVSSLPDTDGRRSRFEFSVGRIDAPEGIVLPPLKTLLVSWYGGAEVKAGEQWRFKVRLRSPRGFMNPGGFDYEGWLFARRISATGYVREGESAVRLASAPARGVLAWREALRERLLRLDISPRTLGFLAALTLGDKSLIPGAAFDQLVATGTVHLMVVSGLHIGIVATLLFLVGSALGRGLSALGSPIPARVVAALVAMTGAGLYGLLAGGELPVQRALIMTLAALVALVLRRRARPGEVFAWALTGVALADPMAATRPGFWLSFGAVAGLMAWFVPRPRVSWWRRLLQAQAVVFITLAPALLYFQGSVSLVALPLNLLAIPWIGFAVVPLCIIGALGGGVPLVGDALWMLAATQLAWFGDLLGWAAEAQQRGFDVIPGFVRSGDGGLLLAGCLLALLALLPRGLGLAWPAVAIAAAIFLSRPPEPPALRVAILDVGQGLAVVVQVRDRTLVYDTGPWFSDAFDTGSAVVAPYLKSMGIHRVDRLIVSHGDRDHAGGVAGLLSRIASEDIVAGQAELLSGVAARDCNKGVAWRWYGVNFKFLWPDGGKVTPPEAGDNNRSCVLLIESAYATVLLPGDIEAPVERRLLNAVALPQRGVSLLVAPHHGSKTSSSPLFVEVLSPDHAVFSAGFNHHFGHPHSDVVERYLRAGSRVWWTAQSGALVFTWHGGDTAVQVEEARVVERRYWHSRGGALESGSSDPGRAPGEVW